MESEFLKALQITIRSGDIESFDQLLTIADLESSDLSAEDADFLIHSLLFEVYDTNHSARPIMIKRLLFLWRDLIFPPIKLKNGAEAMVLPKDFVDKTKFYSNDIETDYTEHDPFLAHLVLKLDPLLLKEMLSIYSDHGIVDVLESIKFRIHGPDAIKCIDKLGLPNDPNLCYRLLQESERFNPYFARALQQTMPKIFANRPSWLKEYHPFTIPILKRHNPTIESLADFLIEKNVDVIVPKVRESFEFVKFRKETIQELRKMDLTEITDMYDYYLEAKQKDWFENFGFTNVSKVVNNELCKRFGGCRMLLCNCNENYNEEIEAVDTSYDWFKNECDHCAKKIRSRSHALRIPFIRTGGWMYCLCSFACARSLLLKSEYDCEERKVQYMILTQMQNELNFSRIFDSSTDITGEVCVEDPLTQEFECNAEEIY